MATGAPDLFARREALLDAWVAKQREIATLQAEAADLLAERWMLMEDDIEDAPLHREAILRSTVCEYAAAGRISRGSMEYAFTDARIVHDDMPTVLDSHTAGRITAAHVREIVREADVVREAIRDGDVEPVTMALYEAAVLEVAEHDTPARAKAHARQVAAALAGVTVVQRHERAVTERAVTVRSVGDGLALLQAVLPEHLALAVHDRLTRMARRLRTADRTPVLPSLEPEPRDQRGVRIHDDSLLGDPRSTEGDALRSDGARDVGGDDDDPGLNLDEQSRWDAIERTLAADPLFHDDSPAIIHVPADARTMDQIRADLFTDLLLATDPTEAHGTALQGITATVQVTVAASTLVGADDRPAELDGTGPLHPDVARTMAGRNTGWTRLFLDPQGMVTETDTYTPTEPMRRFLRARDQLCRFPGCRQPIARCELDHNHDYAKGGRTSLCNLSHFCTAHHVLKHPDIPDDHRWTARQLPDWSVAWTSPTGRTYADPPRRRVMFILSDPPPEGGPPMMSPDELDRAAGRPAELDWAVGRPAETAAAAPF
ncbi:DUF222 domain-containing protein [Microbacterium sp.]|uniref:HNH endonuclease signature motif containing protein n=1 Tax=Microbacterium sp. TaxID=51671 RepID=UPI0028110B38|nr:DUF222 domain-containing protein [Microbacterium sp.]